MIQILENLYLGDCESARDRARLRQFGVTHIVNCAHELPCHFEAEFVYLPLKLQDPDPEFHLHIVKACRFIDAGRRSGRVLVHCFAGVSRSPSVTLAYICHLGDTLEQAAQRLGRITLTNPDDVMLRQLAEHLGLEWTDDDLKDLSMVLLGRRRG